MRKLLSIPTSVRTLVSLEERREATPPDEKNPDVIDLTTVAEEVVDGGPGAAVPGAEAEGDDAPAADISPEAPASAEEAPVEVALATDASVAEPAADVPVEPVAEDGATPPAAGETPAEEPAPAEADVTDPAPAEAPAVGEEPAPVPAEGEVPTEPAAEPVPVEEPVAEPAVEEPAPGEEPSDATPFEEPAVDGTEPSTEEPPVTGEAPAEPPVDGLDTGTDVPPAADDLSPVDGSDVPPASDDPLADPAMPVDGEPAPVEEPVAPVDETPVEETTSAWVDGVSVDAEEIKQEIAEGAEDVVAADDDVEELTEAAVALEAIQEALVINTADEDPIISETTVNLTRVEVNKVLERITDTCDIPSLESAGSKQAVYTLTLEALGEKIKEIWEAIKKAIAAAWSALMNFLKGIFDGATRLKAQVGKLRVAVNGMSSTEPSNATISNSSVHAGVSIDGKDKITPEELNTSVGKLSQVATSFLGNSNKAIHNAMIAIGTSFVTEVQKGIDSSKDDKTAMLGYAIVAYGTLCGQLATNIAPGAKNMRTMIVSGPLPGGFRLQAMVMPKDLEFVGPEEMEIAQAIVNGDALTAERQSNATGTELPTLTQDQMLSMLDQVEGLVDAVLGSKDAVADFEKGVADIQKQGDAAIRSADGTFEGKSSDLQMFRGITAMGPALVKTNSRFCSMLVTLGSNLCKYVASSGKEYAGFGMAVDSTASEPAPAGSTALAPVAA